MTAVWSWASCCAHFSRAPYLAVPLASLSSSNTWFTWSILPWIVLQTRTYMGAEIFLDQKLSMHAPGQHQIWKKKKEETCGIKSCTFYSITYMTIVSSTLHADDFAANSIRVEIAPILPFLSFTYLWQVPA